MVIKGTQTDEDVFVLLYLSQVKRKFPGIFSQVSSELCHYQHSPLAFFFLFSLWNHAQEMNC